MTAARGVFPTALKAQLSPRLYRELLSFGASVPQVFIQRFLEWKSGDEDGSYYFGKDALNRNSKWLRHVHMVPIASPDAIAQWDKNWQRSRARKSDRYLFYSDGGSFGYLLLGVVNDPGAHQFLAKPNSSDRLVLLVMEKQADAFYHFGKLSDDEAGAM
jgi:hypothetical protein